MLPFATEFPVTGLDIRSAFLAEIIAWLRGTQYSSVLNAASDKDLDDDNIYLRADSGEDLQIRALSSDLVSSAIGFRHNNPDREGRLWRTEGVLTRASSDGEESIFRIKTQCLAAISGATLEAPRKPYLIKALLKNGRAGRDGALEIGDRPLWLQDNDDGIRMASAVSAGKATKHLPVLYISAIQNASWLLEKSEIENLAYDLGGVAHLVVEPSRAFSFRLRDATAGQNVYGGTIGLSMPGDGITRRFYLGWRIQTTAELVSWVKEVTRSWRSQAPAKGWEWAELQEWSLRAQRKSLQGAMSVAESEALFDEMAQQLSDLQVENRVLQQKLREQKEAIEFGAEEHEGLAHPSLVGILGPELYPGEVSDRLRFAAIIALSVAEAQGLDKRTIAMLTRLLDRSTPSSALNEFKQDLNRATKDSRKLASDVTALLVRHGYCEKSDNKHIRLEAEESFYALDAITLPKTPGDHRSARNARSQIERTLGLKGLSD